MSKPDPEVGQIIRYDYLWHEEAARGRTEGVKERPCAVIVARRKDAHGNQRVLLAAITHSPPVKGRPAIEIPARFKRKTGLDEARSWLIISELNAVDWADPGIVPAKSGEWLVGRLPLDIAQQALSQAITIAESGQLRTVKRD